MFDWEEFKKSTVAVHCRTKELADDFLSEYDLRGLPFCGIKKAMFELWNGTKGYTCFRYQPSIGNIGYSDLEYYKAEGFKIFDWETQRFLDEPIPTEEAAKDLSIFQRVIEHYGKEKQTIIAIEEMTELTKALTKELRGSGNREHIAEEMADVYICLEQLKIMYDISDEFVEKWKKWKTERIEMRLKESENRGA